MSFQDTHGYIAAQIYGIYYALTYKIEWDFDDKIKRGFMEPYIMSQPRVN